MDNFPQFSPETLFFLLLSGIKANIMGALQMQRTRFFVPLTRQRWHHLSDNWCRSPTAYFLLVEKVGKAPLKPLRFQPSRFYGSSTSSSYFLSAARDQRNPLPLPRLPAPAVQYTLFTFQDGVPCAVALLLGGLHRQASAQSDCWGRNPAPRCVKTNKAGRPKPKGFRRSFGYFSIV